MWPLYLMMSHMVLKKEEQNVNNTKYADSRSTGDIQKEQAIYIMAEQQKMMDSQTSGVGRVCQKTPSFKMSQQIDFFVLSKRREETHHRVQMEEPPRNEGSHHHRQYRLHYKVTEHPKRRRPDDVVSSLHSIQRYRVRIK